MSTALGIRPDTRLRDRSPDGKALRLSDTTSRVTMGTSACANLTAFTAIIIGKPTSFSGGNNSFLSKANNQAAGTGWSILLQGTAGEIRVRWGRVTSDLSYGTTGILVVRLGMYSTIIVTADQSAGAGKIIKVEYALERDAVFRSAVMDVGEGSGAFESDSAQALRFGAATANTNGWLGEIVFGAIFPKLSYALRQQIAQSPLDFRRDALGFWRPGHRGMGPVVDESGNGWTGTLEAGSGTIHAKSSIKRLWFRGWDVDGKRALAGISATVSKPVPLARNIQAQVLLQGTTSKTVPLGRSISTQILLQGTTSKTVPLGRSISTQILVQAALNKPVPLGAVAFASTGPNATVNKPVPLGRSIAAQVLLQAIVDRALPLGRAATTQILVQASLNRPVPIGRIISAQVLLQAMVSKAFPLGRIIAVQVGGVIIPAGVDARVEVGSLYDLITELGAFYDVEARVGHL